MHTNAPRGHTSDHDAFYRSQSIFCKNATVLPCHLPRSLPNQAPAQPRLLESLHSRGEDYPITDEDEHKCDHKRWKQLPLLMILHAAMCANGHCQARCFIFCPETACLKASIFFVLGSVGPVQSKIAQCEHALHAQNNYLLSACFLLPFCMNKSFSSSHGVVPQESREP